MDRLKMEEVCSIDSLLRDIGLNPEPIKSLRNAVRGLHHHASIDSNRFPIAMGVQLRLFSKISESTTLHLPITDQL